MGVRTEADEALAQCEEHLLESLAALNRILVDRVYGHSEFTQAYRNRLWKSHGHLSEAARALSDRGE